MTAIRPTIDYVCSLLHRYGVENVTAEVIRQCKFDSADLNVKLEILRIVHGACLLIKSSYHPNCWQRVPSGSDGKYVSRIEVAWEKRSSNDAAALFVLTQILEWSQCAKNSPPSDIQPVSQPFLSPVHAQVLFPGLINLISDRSRLLQQRSEYISKLADAQAKQEEKEAALNTSAQVMLSKEPQRKGGKLLDNGVVVQLSSREMLLVLAWLWMSSSGLRQSDENNGLSGLPNATPDTASETPLAHSLSLFSVHICSLIKRIAHSPLLPPFSPDPSILYLSETCPLGRHTSSSPPNTLPSSSSSSLPSSSFVTIPPYYGSPELDLLRALNTQTANPLIHSLPDPSSLPSPSSFASPSKSLSPTSQPSDDVLSEMLLFVRYRTRQLVTLVAEIRSLFLRLDANHSRIPHMAALLKRDLSSSSESHLNNGSELHSGERQSANNDKRGSRHQPTCTERTVKAQHTKVIEMQKAAEMQLRAIETADRDSVITSSSSSGGGGNGEDVSSSSATVTRARTILEMKSMYSLMTECSSKFLLDNAIDHPTSLKSPNALSSLIITSTPSHHPSTSPSTTPTPSLATLTSNSLSIFEHERLWWGWISSVVALHISSSSQSSSPTSFSSSNMFNTPPLLCPSAGSTSLSSTSSSTSLISSPRTSLESVSGLTNRESTVSSFQAPFVVLSSHAHRSYTRTDTTDNRYCSLACAEKAGDVQGVGGNGSSGDDEDVAIHGNNMASLPSFSECAFALMGGVASAVGGYSVTNHYNHSRAMMNISLSSSSPSNIKGGYDSDVIGEAEEVERRQAEEWLADVWDDYSHFTSDMIMR